MANGLRTIEEYLEILEKFYPNVPYAEIKAVEKKFKNESDMKQELERLDKLYSK